MPIRNNKEPISYSKTKSHLVIELAKNLNIDLKTLAIFWNRAKARVALRNNCKIHEDDYAIIVDIFKREIVKYFPDSTKKYPKLFPKSLLQHRQEPIESLDEVLKRYRKEIKLAKQRCKNFYRIIPSQRKNNF